jgi:hypothetical protein
MYTLNHECRFWQRRVKQELFQTRRQIEFKKKVKSNKKVENDGDNLVSFNFYQRGTADPNNMLQTYHKQHFLSPYRDSSYISNLK